MPSSALLPPRGVTRTVRVMPSFCSVQGAPTSEDIRQDVQFDAQPDEIDDEDQNNGRNIDPSEARQQVSNRPQGRLGDPIKEIPYLTNGRVVAVDHVKRDQPGKHCRSNQYPDVQLKGEVDYNKEGAHGGLLLVNIAETFSGREAVKQAVKCCA